MIYLRYRTKIEHVADCKICEGRGSTGYNQWVDTPVGKMNMGIAILCRCIGGKTVTYPWTRGKSVPPLISRKKRKP